MFQHNAKFFNMSTSDLPLEFGTLVNPKIGAYECKMKNIQMNLKKKALFKSLLVWKLDYIRVKILPAKIKISEKIAIIADFTLPLDIENLKIISQHKDSKVNFILTVVSTCTETTCHKCGKPATKRYGYTSPIEIRHTSVFDTPVDLTIKPVRYQCEPCDDHPTTTEKYNWMAETVIKNITELYEHNTNDESIGYYNKHWKAWAIGGTTENAAGQFESFLARMHMLEHLLCALYSRMIQRQPYGNDLNPI